MISVVCTSQVCSGPNAVHGFPSGLPASAGGRSVGGAPAVLGLLGDHPHHLCDFIRLITDSESPHAFDSF